MPRSLDLAIFVLTTTDKTNYIAPCACTRGNKNDSIHKYVLLHNNNYC